MKASMRYANITLRSSGQLWSNPALREREEGLPAMLAKPNFLDLLQLAIRFTVPKVAAVNARLFDTGEISRERFEITGSMLHNIERGIQQNP